MCYARHVKQLGIQSRDGNRLGRPAGPVAGRVEILRLAGPVAGRVEILRLAGQAGWKTGQILFSGN